MKAKLTVMGPPVREAKGLVYSAVALSLVAALIHLWVTPEHFGEWWGYGTFMLAAFVAQAIYAVFLLWWPRAVCTSIDRLRYLPHESLFDGSEGEGACCCRSWHTHKRDSSHAGCLSAHHKTLSEVEKRDGIGGTQASSQTSFLNRPERRAQKSLMETARRA